jgi:hypothetical protein
MQWYIDLPHATLSWLALSIDCTFAFWGAVPSLAGLPLHSFAFQYYLLVFVENANAGVIGITMPLPLAGTTTTTNRWRRRMAWRTTSKLRTA